MRFEEALALALADAGLLPGDDAEAVAEACRVPVTDPDAVLAATWSHGTPMVPLLEEIRGRLSEEHAKWVHYGTTTQDVLDTATMLQAGEALEPRFRPCLVGGSHGRAGPRAPRPAYRSGGPSSSTPGRPPSG